MLFNTDFNNNKNELPFEGKNIELFVSRSWDEPELGISHVSPQQDFVICLQVFAVIKIVCYKGFGCLQF